ncbi:MAG: SDR family oxidoreductase [Chloroflexi bacterium]|nr:SDR family oxidoreductase [Chloroflexota bacterium]
MKDVIIITGTRKGIGRYLSEHYISQGYLVAGCSREPSALESSSYQHFCLDVADESAVRQMVLAVARKYGRIYALINNAGIASMNHVLLTPLSSFEHTFRTNVFGTFLFCREVARAMSRNGQGRIVNFSTVAVPLKLEGEAAYAASKAAIVTLTQVLAMELGELGITVNAVGPTPVQTDLIRGVSRVKIEGLLERQAIKRFGAFEDISNVIDFFLKPESGFVTGQVVYLGGV